MKRLDAIVSRYGFSRKEEPVDGSQSLICLSVQWRERKAAWVLFDPKEESADEYWKKLLPLAATAAKKAEAALSRGAKDRYSPPA